MNPNLVNAYVVNQTLTLAPPMSFDSEASDEPLDLETMDTAEPQHPLLIPYAKMFLIVATPRTILLPLIDEDVVSSLAAYKRLAHTYEPLETTEDKLELTKTQNLWAEVI